MVNLFSDIDSLVRYLTYHCAAPQPAERWAMYRLITPVVDFACQKIGWQPFFEYNQTSAHNTSQSVDIALLQEGVPRMLIEAKRAKRIISRQQIEKYLEPDLPGIVSNGTDWILCRNADGHHVRIWDDEEQRISRADVEHVISFIMGGAISGDRIDAETDIKPVLRPKRPAKAQIAQRTPHTIEKIASATALLAFSARNSRLTALDRDFLEAFASSLTKVPENIGIEARETRMSVWGFSIGKNDRIMRIEFGRRQPSVIIKTSIVGAQPELSDGVAHSRHDKHGGMREFRLANEHQARSLGHNIAALLTRGCR